jgi:exonuclease III
MCAHTNLEVWNDGAKHLAAQAGVTQQERDSFQHQLDTSGFLQMLSGDSTLLLRAAYSYWSQRAGNREPNKGLRLDYFVVPQNFSTTRAKWLQGIATCYTTSLVVTIVL